MNELNGMRWWDYILYFILMHLHKNAVKYWFLLWYNIFDSLLKYYHLVLCFMVGGMRTRRKLRRRRKKINLIWSPGELIREEYRIHLSLTFRRTCDPGLFVSDLTGCPWYLDDTRCLTRKMYWNNFTTIRNIIQLIYFYILKEKFKYEKCTTNVQ